MENGSERLPVVSHWKLLVQLQLRPLVDRLQLDFRLAFQLEAAALIFSLNFSQVLVFL